jgi:hypothetical protein
VLYGCELPSWVIYYDTASRLNSWEYIPHSIRLPALQGSYLVGEYNYTVSSTADYLSKIILGGSLAERSVEARISQWAVSVSKAKRATPSQPEL